MEVVTNVLWRRGDLSWKLRPEQEELKQHIDFGLYELIVGNLSRRWGKSYLLVLYCVEQCLKSRQNIRYGAAFKSDLEEFILPAFEVILSDCPTDLRPRYFPSKQVWIFPSTGARIKLIGLDKNPNGLRGNAISIIVVDEAGFVTRLQYLYESVIIPATAKQKNIRILIFSTPPPSPEHFFVKLIDKATLQENGLYREMDIDTISDLEPAERKRLLDEQGGEKSPTAQREFFCKIRIDASRAIAPSFEKERHVGVCPTDPAHIAWRVFGDVGGVKDLSVFHKVGYDQNTGIVHFADEIWFPRFTPTPVIMTGVKEKFPGLSVVADMHGQSRVDFSAEGLQSAETTVDNRSAMINAGLPFLNTAFHNDRMMIDPKCVLLIRTLEGGMLNNQRTDFERSEALGHCDAAASAVYGIRGVDRVTDLRPRPDPMQVFHVRREPEMVRNIKQMGWGAFV